MFDITPVGILPDDGQVRSETSRSLVLEKNIIVNLMIIFVDLLVKITEIPSHVAQFH